MPDIAEGLSSDPNSESGFLAALAQQVGTEVPEEKLEELERTDTSVAAGLTEESAPTPNRDESGRFAPAATSDADDEGVASAGEGGGDEEVQVDPAVTEFLTRHEGNAEAALAAALREKEEAQSLIGRQGNELGDVRQELARLNGRLDERQTTPQAPAQVPMVDDNTLLGLENMAEQQGGRNMMTWVVSNRPDLIDHAEKVWVDVDPYEGGVFAARRAANEVVLAERAREPQTPQQPQQEDSFVQGLRQERQFNEVFDAVRTGMKPTEWDAVKDHLMPALETSSPLVRNAVVSPDRDTQIEGVKLLVDLAKGRVVATANAQTTQDQAALERKRAAQVASGSLRPVQERQPESGEELTSEQRREAFHKALMATETTSVRDGLVEVGR